MSNVGRQHVPDKAAALFCRRTLGLRMCREVRRGEMR